MTTRIKAWTLVLMAAVSVATPLPAAAASLTQNDGIVHIVQPGENLFRVSLRHGVSMDAIVQANGLASP